MTDKVYSDGSSNFGAAIVARSRASTARAAETVVNLPSRPPEPDERTSLSRADDRGAGPKPGDWTSALHLVEEASEAIRIGEERANELESQLEQVMIQAAEEVRRLNAELSASEQRAARAEDRTRAAEARANEAEAWLARLHNAVHSAFGPMQRGARSGSAS